MKDILVILPSRGRPEKAKEAIDSWQKTETGYSQLLVCTDHDDPLAKNYPQYYNVNYRQANRSYIGDIINQVSKDEIYDYYAFIGDDHRFRTKGWDQLAIETIEKKGNGWGIVYGNDLLQGEKLATAAIVSGNIVRALGYMSLPGLHHLYIDNFWMEIGRGIDRLFYVPEIVIEHMHFSVGKSEKDDLYAQVNSPEMYSHDSQIFSEWARNYKQEDIERIKKKINGI